MVKDREKVCHEGLDGMLDRAVRLAGDSYIWQCCARPCGAQGALNLVYLTRDDDHRLLENIHRLTILCSLRLKSKHHNAASSHLVSYHLGHYRPRATLW